MRAPLRSLSIIALLATAAAVPAFAQTASNAPLSTYPTCTGQPTQADTNAAHGAYMAGKGSFDEADYARAIEYFKDAYRRDCTKPELLVIIARAYELQGNRREAVNALETYVQRAPNAQDVEVQRRHIANLKKELAEQPAPSAAAPPSATATASAPPSATASASAAPTATAAPTAEPSAAPPPPERKHSVLPWVVVGAGGAVAVTGGVLFAVGSGDVSSAEKDCPSHTNCAKSVADKGNTGRSLETVGAVLGGVGLAGVVGGLVWHFLEQPSGSAQATVGRPVVAPQIGPGYAGVGVGARF